MTETILKFRPVCFWSPHSVSYTHPRIRKVQEKIQENISNNLETFWSSWNSYPLLQYFHDKSNRAEPKILSSWMLLLWTGKIPIYKPGRRCIAIYIKTSGVWVYSKSHQFSVISEARHVVYQLCLTCGHCNGTRILKFLEILGLHPVNYNLWYFLSYNRAQIFIWIYLASLEWFESDMHLDWLDFVLDFHDYKSYIHLNLFYIIC